MTQKKRVSNPNLLEKVKEGMTVYDVNGKKIGKVDDIHFGDEDPNRFGAETLRAPRTGQVPDELSDLFLEGLSNKEKIPHELLSRMLRQGFIRIEAGRILSSKHYALLEQIKGIGEDSITLNVTHDKLYHF
jgi:sporulation protein YlmC with PRC-barrel domain